MKYIEALQY